MFHPVIPVLKSSSDVASDKIVVVSSPENKYLGLSIVLLHYNYKRTCVYTRMTTWLF